MAFPTIPTVAGGRLAGLNQLNTTATLTGPDLTALTGRAAGDLVLAIAGEYQSNAGADAAFTGWAGGGLTWTEIRDSTGTANGRLGVAYARLVTGTETGAVTVTRSGTLVGDASMILLCIPGAHATTAPEASAAVHVANAAADPAVLNPAVWGAEDTLWIGVNGNGMTSGTGSWTANTSAPTNYTDYFDTNAADTSTIGDFELAVAFRQLNATSEDIGTFGQDTSNARSSALIIAVRPAPTVFVAPVNPVMGPLHVATFTLEAPSRILGGLHVPIAGDTNAPAGVASATGDVPQPEVTIAPNAGSPIAAGSALQATVVTGTSAPAGFASAAGTANQPEVTVASNAGNATAAGSAPQPEAEIGAKPNTAAAAGTAPQPTVTTAASTNAPAGLAAATGTAPQPTVQTTEGAAPARPIVVIPTAQSILIRRRQATATFVDLGAPVVQEDTNAPAGLASATGTANQPEATIGAKPGAPTAAGAAPQPTVETGAFTNAPAGLAAATGTANAASVTIRPNAGVGLAAGVAPQPEATVGGKPGFGLAAGSAPQPTVVIGRNAPAGLAAAAGTANQPEIDIKVLAGVAAAAGEAFPVFGLTGNPLGPPQGIVAVDDDHSLAIRDPIGLIAVDDDHSL